MNLQFSKPPKILDVMEGNGLKTFIRPNELNIIGIRSSNTVSKNLMMSCMFVIQLNSAHGINTFSIAPQILAHTF